MSYVKLNLILCLLMIALVGCREANDIQVHEVPKSQSGLDRFNEAIEAFENAGEPVEVVPSRMIVGLVMRSDATWTFKILGPASDFPALNESWKDFFTKLGFSEAGSPVFEIPEGWTDKGTRKGMFSSVQTLFLNNESPPVKMEISSLTAGQDLVGNINRWRRQLELEPVGPDTTLPKFEYEGGEYYLFDETGVFAQGMPPFAGASNNPAPKVPSVPVGDDIQFDLPEGWEQGKPSMVVKVRLQSKTGQGATEITVAKMSSNNEWDINVREWANQIGFDGFKEGDAVARTSELEVAGVFAKRVRLVEEDEKFKKAIIGVMFKKLDYAWFVKLAGDKEAVVSKEAEFEKFLTSLQIAK